MTFVLLQFRASFSPDQVLFTYRIEIYVMCINNKCTLHVIDTHGNFQNSAIIRDTFKDNE